MLLENKYTKEDLLQKISILKENEYYEITYFIKELIVKKEDHDHLYKLIENISDNIYLYDKIDGYSSWTIMYNNIIINISGDLEIDYSDFYLNLKYIEKEILNHDLQFIIEHFSRFDYRKSMEYSFTSLTEESRKRLKLAEDKIYRDYINNLQSQRLARQIERDKQIKENNHSNWISYCKPNMEKQQKEKEER